LKKPIIGVSPLFDITLRSMWMYGGYFEGIEDAGGIPVMLSIKNGPSEVDRILDVVDGIMLPGGHDICPLNFGENVSAFCGQTLPGLDDTEILLAKGAFKQSIPLLGICRGCQLINVAMGGTLYQDIKETVERSVPILHSQQYVIPKKDPVHSVSISRGSRLYECFGKETVWVNSFHHQANKTIAPTLVATAYAEDGVVEAVECGSKDRFILGVQWHPELMFRHNEDARNIFKYFVDYASGNVTGNV